MKVEREKGGMKRERDEKGQLPETNAVKNNRKRIKNII
jgi:hypothetical protein